MGRASQTELAAFDVNFEDIDIYIKVCPISGKYGISFVLRRDWRMRARTVEIHERIECPILGIIALLTVVGLIKRPGFEVSSAPELWVTELYRAAPMIRRKDTEHERRQRYSRIPMPRNREHTATSLVRTMTRR